MYRDHSDMTLSLELPIAEFSRVAALFPTGLPNRTMVFSTLDGRTPGRVYVDNLQTPTACVVQTAYYNWSFVGGEPDATWLDNVLQTMRVHAAFFITDDPALAAFQNRVAPTRIAERFGFDDRKDDGLPYNLPPGFELRAITPAIFSRCTWHKEIVLAMGTDENFFRQGRGLCILHGDEICSEAYAVFHGDNKFELGIITNEHYRGRGFAYTVCKALARECEASGISVYWSCDRTNLGSVATARKIGFQTSTPYRLLHFAKSS